MAVLCEETACLVMKMYHKYCCQEICCMFNDSACISSSFFADFVIYQVFKLIYSHCGIPIWDLFIYSLLCVCGIAETWIPYTDFDLLKSHFCTGINYWNVSCKFDDMLQNFCVFDNRLRFKNPLSSLVIWQFIILFFVEK